MILISESDSVVSFFADSFISEVPQEPRKRAERAKRDRFLIDMFYKDIRYKRRESRGKMETSLRVEERNEAISMTGTENRDGRNKTQDLRHKILDF
jgi:hypothetical protein